MQQQEELGEKRIITEDDFEYTYDGKTKTGKQLFEQFGHHPLIGDIEFLVKHDRYPNIFEKEWYIRFYYINEFYFELLKMVLCILPFAIAVVFIALWLRDLCPAHH